MPKYFFFRCARFENQDKFKVYHQTLISRNPRIISEWNFILVQHF